MDAEDLAKTFFEKQLATSKKSKDLAQIANAHLNLGNLTISKTDDNNMPTLICEEKIAEAEACLLRAFEAIETLERLIKEGLQLKERQNETDQLRLDGYLLDSQIKILHKDLTKLDLAEEKIKFALEGYRKITNTKKQFEALGLLARIFIARGKIQSSIEECYDLQLELARSTRDVKLERTALFNLAIAYRRLCDYNLSLQTFYLYQDLLKSTISPPKYLLALIENEIAKTLRLKKAAEELEALETENNNGIRNLIRLTKLCQRLELWEDGWKYARQAAELSINTENVTAEILILAANFAIKSNLPDDAIFYVSKLAECLEGVKDFDYLVLLFDAHHLNQKVPVPEEILNALKTFLKTNNTSPEQRLELYNRLALGYRLRGLDQFHEMRDECISLWVSIRLANSDQQVQELANELANLDYFAQRKASKNIMKLLDGNFNMKSRSKMGSKGMKLRRGLLSDHKKANNSRIDSKQLEKHSKAVSRIVMSSSSEEVEGKMTFRESLKDFIDDESCSSDDFVPHNHMELDSPPLHWPDSPKAKKHCYNIQGLGSGKSDDTWESGNPINPPIRSAISLRDPNIGSVLRVTVKVEDATFIIPVVDDIAERKSVAWLIKEAGLRYEQEFGREPIINCLRTEEGYRLLGADPVSLLLRDGQKVLANVNGYKQKPLAICYREVCKAHKKEPVTIIEESMSSFDDDVVDWSHLGHQISPQDIIDMIDATIKFTTLGGIIRTIKFHHLVSPQELARLHLASIIHLDLSFTDIGKFDWIAVNFPNLRVLKLNWCQLDKLDALFKLWVSKDSPLEVLECAGSISGGLIDLGDLYLLSSLKELDLSFGHIDNSMTLSLIKILSCSSSLKILRLKGCSSDDKDFPISAILERGLTRNSSLQLVDLSGLNIDADQVAVLNSISPRCKIVY